MPAWRGLTCFGSRCSRGCRESCSYISHNYPSICEQPHTKTIRKPCLLPLDSAVSSGNKLSDRSRDPGISRMLNALRILFGSIANAWVYDPVVRMQSRNAWFDLLQSNFSKLQAMQQSGVAYAITSFRCSKYFHLLYSKKEYFDWE